MNVKLKQLAVVQMGYSFRTRLEAQDHGSVSVIQMKDLLYDNTVGCTSLSKVDLKQVKSHHFALKGDLIFRSRGLVTTSAIVRDTIDMTVVAAPLLRIRVTKPDKILSEYLNWYISQRDAQIFLTSRAKGTVQKMISKQTIEDLHIPLPSLKKQNTIVELASLSDLEQTLVRTLTEKREQYISAVLTHFAKGE